MISSRPLRLGRVTDTARESPKLAFRSARLSRRRRSLHRRRPSTRCTPPCSPQNGRHTLGSVSWATGSKTCGKTSSVGIISRLSRLTPMLAKTIRPIKIIWIRRFIRPICVPARAWCMSRVRSRTTASNLRWMPSNLETLSATNLTRPSSFSCRQVGHLRSLKLAKNFSATSLLSCRGRRLRMWSGRKRSTRYVWKSKSL